tara:strand:+ start:169 stop:381 length:213 start_codon:yes stop_codon:yes gene_type:complete
MTDILKGAYKINLKAGKKYKLCTCGTSQMLPYCDDSHRKLNEEKGTNYKSLKIVPKEDITIDVSSKTWKK